MFKDGMTIEGVMAEALDIIENDPSRILKTGTSARGAPEMILDFGRKINETGTTNEVRMWLEKGVLRSIHPLVNKIK
ncbi:hypothetical protein V6R21_04980 [Limibacter armeniacum]|uniref:hypothetical protein n=1 Tax=Limibacter armeniacum TaxID=466084 RepID=UPI002FE5AF03